MSGIKYTPTAPSDPWRAHLADKKNYLPDTNGMLVPMNVPKYNHIYVIQDKHYGGDKVTTNDNLFSTSMSIPNLYRGV